MTDNVNFFRNLMEIFTTRQNLVWNNNHGFLQAQFTLDDHSYGISIIEDSHDNVSFYDVSFHIINSDAISHSATAFNKNQFKILGIVSNAIREKIPQAEVIYFSAKKETCNSEQEFENKKSLYHRLCHKIGRENNMNPIVVDVNNEIVYGLCKTQELANKFKQSI